MGVRLLDADGSVGVVTGYRLHRTAAPAWYWAALARRGEPLLHVTEWDVPARSDPLLVKAHGLWAEHVCDAPMEQWTVANETYAAALDDPDDALGPGLRAAERRGLRPRVVRHRAAARRSPTATTRTASSTASSSSPAARCT